MGDVTQAAKAPQKPIMIFDGDCNFCRRWIGRWQQATGNAVDYLPFQDPAVAERFPELPREQCEKAVQLVETDGRMFRGAEAVFRALAHAPGRAWPLWIYRRMPGAAPFTELLYRLVASHRTFFSALTKLLWGKHVERPACLWSRGLFLRLLGLIYFSAFLSLWTQVDGMVGSNGILPVEQFIRVVGHHFEQQEIGPLRRYLIAPTLCWISPSDRFLHLQCGAGAVLALLLMGGVASAPCLAFLWLLYLSLTTIGDIFLGYQWDALLLETGFLAIFFAPWNLLPKSPSRESRPSPTVLWLLRWLLFRLMFASGAVKLLSGDETWRNLSALNYHYETQPLPTWIGWFAHQLPAWFQKTSLIGMFGIELVMPFFIFFPRRLRMIACWSFIGLQVVIALTGNYCFFNLLTIVLCVVLMDDTAILKLFPGKWRRHFGNPGGEGSNYFVQEMSTARFAAGIGRRVLVGLIALVILILTGMQMLGTFRVRVEWPQSLVKLFEYVAPFRSVNSYGLFAVMTTSRPEIIIEGSNDGQNWLAYEFKHKPGDLRRRQRFVAPHQPRLDWQMWFEALRAPGRGPPSGWFRNFCRRLLQGSPEVLSLMERNPFPNAPPKYVRAMVYDYHFTNSAEWRATGIWWRRELIGQYGPVFR